MYVIQKWEPKAGVWLCVPGEDGIVRQYGEYLHAYRYANQRLRFYPELEVEEGKLPPDTSLSVWWRIAQVQL